MTAQLAHIEAIGHILVTAVDGGLVGSTELRAAGRLVSVVRRGATLSAQEARQAQRILDRCAGALRSAGLALPEPPAVEVSPVAAPPADVPTVRVRSDGRIGVQAPFRFRDTLKALPGSRAEKRDGKWEWHYPATPVSAGKLVAALRGSHPRISKMVADLVQEYEQRGDALSVLDESGPLPVFDESSLIKSSYRLRDYQKRGVEFSSRVSASLLAVPMGGGKTITTIATVNRVEARRVVIVCPSKVRGVWPREVRKASAQRWHIVNGLRPSKRAASGWVSLSLTERLHEAEQALFDCACDASVHAVVINYEAMAKDPWASWRPRQKLDVVIYDEAHRLKSPTGVTSKNVAKWVDFSRRRIGLTGTPVPNSPLDIFGLFRALDPGIYGSIWSHFRARYGIPNPHIEQQVIGYRNVEELATNFFSITHRPVIDLKLPAVTDITRECELEPKAARLYRDLSEELWADLREFVAHGDARELEQHTGIDAEAQEYGKTITPANVMVQLLRLQQLTGGTVIDDDGDRLRVSTAKADLLEEVLDEVGCTRSAEEAVHAPEPVVVFCRFRSDLDAVQEIAHRRGLRYAEISGRRHDGLTHESEMNPEADIVGVQIQSGGTGVDLTRARVGIWYSLGYSLSDYDQARKRLDRPGQTRPVVMVHLLAEGTADYEVYEALDTKRSVIAGVLSGHGVDAEALGFRESVTERADDDRTVTGGAVPLPFAQLLRAEKARYGEPTR